METPEKVNILLVDDRIENLLVLEAALSGLALNPVRAYSGEVALECLLREKFALILLDVQMPRMDGLETAALIRERERSGQTPIIFITAFERSPSLVFKGYSIGAVDFLFKPIVPEILRSKVMVFAELYRKVEEVKRQARQLEEEIARRKQAEEEIRKLNESLEARVAKRTAELTLSNQELEAFSYSVAHDLRAPLRSINGFSQRLLDNYTDQLDEKGKNYLQRVCASSRRMGQLIEDLLKLSRISRCEMSQETVDLSALAEEVATELRRDQPERRVELVIVPGLMAQGDGRLLRVALENLLGNAWKFTGNHSHVRIEFGVTRHNDQRVYFVRDDGVGFDMAYGNKLFKAFERLHPVAEFPGNGIGLAIVRRIIHRHGGLVWAEGALEQGATFYFTLGSGLVSFNPDPARDRIS